jgi:uncharacterized protein involved in type VI secretion and phage assembly
MDDQTARYIEGETRKCWGKHLGRVVDRNDPLQLGRLKLRVPSVLADATTGWAWPVTPYAGAGIGFFFVPRVEDVVWVEFFEGDLSHPIWSGCAWTRPEERSEIPREAKQHYPDQCVIKTPSGITIILSDAPGRERVTIRAANGCEIVMDPNANTVTVRAGEILLRGPAGTTEELATRTFVQEIFDKHTHPSGVGPTGPPTKPSSTNPRSLTQVVKAE